MDSFHRAPKWIATCVIIAIVAVVAFFVISAFVSRTEVVTPKAVAYPISVERYALPDGGTLELGFSLLLDEGDVDQARVLLEGDGEGGTQLRRAVQGVVDGMDAKALAAGADLEGHLGDLLREAINQRVFISYNRSLEGQGHPIHIRSIEITHFKIEKGPSAT